MRSADIEYNMLSTAKIGYSILHTAKSSMTCCGIMARDMDETLDGVRDVNFRDVHVIR